MVLAHRIEALNDSITLKVNEMVIQRQESGEKIFNLTGGQLPFKPMEELTQCIAAELNFLKSFQYAPVQGFVELRNKLKRQVEDSRNISLDEKYDVQITNGSKQAIFNALGAIINPGDEVIVLTPYWVSYPEIVKFWGGEIKFVKNQDMGGHVPFLEDISEAIGKKTRAIIINSPNNPSGIHYPVDWMKGLSEILSKNESIYIISDEIYFDLYYFDPVPSYFYQWNKSLLKRTIIVDGISKSMASTGLRVGYAIADNEIIQGMSKLQAQSTSATSSLMQMALLAFDWDKSKMYLEPVKNHLRTNANILRKKLMDIGLESIWYQTNSAFYFLIDFSRTPIFERYKSQGDCSSSICVDLLEEYGVAVVPGGDFGQPNSARMSLVIEEVLFREALERLGQFLIK
ncbi:pyridoxal phosphate-dependent aminotransferase [Bacteriovoracaceae bacterium]|nr:pyridoxal phosphate-dependent aminotransferase [Bacteriovoracaceae bacterium]